MIRVLPNAEDCTIISSFVWTKHRTDRCTDSPWLLQRAMRTRCKNSNGVHEVIRSVEKRDCGGKNLWN